MDGLKTFSGMEVLQQDLDFLQSSKEAETKYRLVDIYVPGIVYYTSLPMVVLGTTSGTIMVKANIAYDSNGERIYISSNQDNLTPTGGWISDSTYQITERYKYTEDTPAPHPITGQLSYTRTRDSFEIKFLRITGQNPEPVLATDVKLARVTIDSTGIITSILSTDIDILRIDASKIRVQIPTSDTPRPNTIQEAQYLSLQEWLTARGTGNLTATNPIRLSLSDLGAVGQTDLKQFQRESHSNGIVDIELISQNVVIDALDAEIDVSTSPNSIKIRQTRNAEIFYVSGNRFNQLVGTPEIGTFKGQPDQTYLRVNFTALDPSGDFYIFIDDSGRPDRTVADITQDLTKMIIWKVTFSGTPGYTLSGLTDLRSFGLTGDSNVIRGSLSRRALNPLVIDTLPLSVIAIDNKDGTSDVFINYTDPDEKIDHFVLEKYNSGTGLYEFVANITK